MTLTVRQFACLSDNYGFLIRDEATGTTATIDTPDADAIAAELAASGWGRLDFILNTHWHPDHAGGNERLKAELGCQVVGPGEVSRITALPDRVVGGGETVMLGETALRVIATPGHTLGHIAYVSDADAMAFVGDTLFALGCGRLFEGTAEQMWSSLQALAALPPETRVFCAHEYTAANARFALSVDDAARTAERAKAVFAARERGEWTVPTTIGAELAANPFLRAPALARAGEADAEAFGRLRAAKDQFAG